MVGSYNLFSSPSTGTEQTRLPRCCQLRDSVVRPPSASHAVLVVREEREQPREALQKYRSCLRFSSPLDGVLARQALHPGRTARLLPSLHLPDPHALWPLKEAHHELDSGEEILQMQ